MFFSNNKDTSLASGEPKTKNIESTESIIKSLALFGICSFVDSLATFGHICSAAAGLTFSIANSLNQQVDLSYYGQANASLSTNVTVEATFSEKQHLDIETFFTRDKIGNLSYNVKDFINPKTFYNISACILTLAVFSNAISNILRKFIESKKEKLFEKRNQDFKITNNEYIFSAIDSTIDSLKITFFTMLILNEVISTFTPYDKPYVYNFPFHNSIEPLNSSATPKLYINKLETFDYNYKKNYLIEIEYSNIKSFNISIDTTYFIYTILDLLIAYTGRICITNKEKSTNRAFLATGITCLFLLGRYCKNNILELKHNRLLDYNEYISKYGSLNDLDLNGPPSLDSTQAQQPFSNDNLDMTPINSINSLDLAA